MHPISRVAFVFPAFVLAACAIKQDVRPVVGLPSGQQVCIVDAPSVRQGFRDELVASLRRKGFQPEVKPAGSPTTVCPVTVTYLARWSWDLTIYLSYAEVNVYRDGIQGGSARYDSTRGGANMGKFIDAERKVNELVEQLFPAG